MTDATGAAHQEDHERVADEHIRRLLDRYVALSGATLAELGPHLFQLVVPAADRAAFGRRSVVRIAFSVEAMQDDERAEMAIVGSPFAQQLIDAIRRHGDRQFVGRVMPGARDESSTPPSPVSIRNARVTGSAIAMRRHRVGRMTARIVVRAGADVREHLAESALIDLCTGIPLPADVAGACAEAAVAPGIESPSLAWDSFDVASILPIGDLVPRMLTSLEEGLRPEIAKLESESQRSLAHELGRIERYYSALLEDLGGRGTEIASADARVAYQAEHARRKKEETERHEVRATVHPIQLEEFELLVQSAEWGAESSTGHKGTLLAQRVLAGFGTWSIRCPTCAGPLNEGVICRSDHMACDLCSLACGVCRDNFCRGHGLAACHVDGAPACSAHARRCGSCNQAHCGRHEGACDESGHLACSTCLSGCAHCGRVICDRHATSSNADAPLGARRLCSRCVRHCEGGTGEVVGPDEVTGCASCARVVCARHQARCDVDKQVHCSKHLRRTDRSRRLVCDKNRARCLHEPNAVFARDEIAECATCAADTCATHSAVCVVDGLLHCTTHLSPVKDRAGAYACLPHQSRCHVDEVVFTIEGTTACVCCGKRACSQHFKECDSCGRRLCVRDFSASSPKTCATCAKLAYTMEIPDDILAASISVRGDGGQPKGWRMARDAGHRVVDMDMGWTRRLTMSVPHGSSRADSVMAHSILGRRRIRPK